MSIESVCAFISIATILLNLYICSRVLLRVYQVRATNRPESFESPTGAVKD